MTTPTTPAEPPTTTTPTTPVEPPTTTTPTNPTDPPRARAAADADPRALGPARYPNVGDAAAAGAGTPVGALLISSYTPSGRVDTTPANAFTLLRTLQEIYGVDPLGYAAADGIAPLSDDLFSVTP
ncbi:hypothetical protein VSS74_11080 [Conexibacter stalactiti]|uniref:Uncharacterized protein n=1 Tax=Conexibacter stalactiti TaxID=1940611 RepID=A0ABU4HNR9_9ACTN|nr:hypothetical protein [Conexibacter stalactiti]MDW5594885.1 hypothetical protein [Conexibacter stalactiti]MEC5035527.1 hypothetical protein [Conexibacter stalactiti]